ncbi:hypothetical protein OUZ56_005333 [Daphnia magna]|uniref:Alpha-1,3-glucosyltransferase n=1 Tax=Daphnia magna TaxID=35525 RepID=A0ABQ9YSI6_9CRUS|nr:hypothetical protein OUZ56_005333 [Daphnia magna]
MNYYSTCGVVEERGKALTSEGVSFTAEVVYNRVSNGNFYRELANKTTVHVERRALRKLEVIALTRIIIKLGVSVFPYSGKNQPPKFGDYEAQRHWMEVTDIQLIRYRNTTDTNLLYWGLDYPPLTAYQSYLTGLVAKKINQDYVKLHVSWGFENFDNQHFMRMSVLGKNVLAAIAFSAALNFKQMELYHAIPIFFYLLASCQPKGSSLPSQLKNLVQIGAATVATFAIIWYPFLQIHDGLLQQVIVRIFIPFQRGIFEDYVANFWCTLNVVIKIKRLLNPTSIALGTIT